MASHFISVELSDKYLPKSSAKPFNSFLHSSLNCSGCSSISLSNSDLSLAGASRLVIS